jgi:Rrf2 family transcriptional regulator, cysteine metabolism repressor
MLVPHNTSNSIQLSGNTLSMNISGKCDYACRAMLELAARYEAEIPVPSQVIAEQRSIPEKYLTHILLQLKRSKLVHSLRGAQGGYILADSPNKISLLQIIESIDGPILAPPKFDGHILPELDSLWHSISGDFAAILSGYTLDKMLDTTSKSNMFHI